MTLVENKRKSEVIKDNIKISLNLIEDKNSYQKISENNSNFKDISSLSVKMEKEESKTDIINDKVEKEIISKNIIITKINNNSSKINNNHLFKFTEKLYNSDEHLVKTNLLKKKN